MTVMISLLAMVRNLPWQVWFVAALALGVGLYGCSQYDAGGDAARTMIEKANDKARNKADEAGRTVENCTGTWDRARGVCLPAGDPGE